VLSGTAQAPKNPKPVRGVFSDSVINAKIDSLFSVHADRSIYENASSKARMAKNEFEGNSSSLVELGNDRKVFLIQWHKILASSLACIAMFLIGAPLGAIIKKGGLGVPFLVSILFFIIYYLLTMTGEKWAKQGIISVQVGVWAGDVILFVIGLIFLRQARLDARLFEADFYMVLMDKARKWAILKKIIPTPAP
jgi:lipopolysaccharide export system permease protein